mgnify:CR=1 FL=1
MPRKGQVPAARIGAGSEVRQRPRHALRQRADGARQAVVGRAARSTARWRCVEQKTGQDAMTVLKQAMTNVKPVLEVKSRRVGGANYQVPVEVRPDRRNALAIRWIISFARARADHTFAEKFAAELLAASPERRRRGEEARRHAQDGGGQQGLRSLSLVAHSRAEGRPSCRPGPAPRHVAGARLRRTASGSTSSSPHFLRRKGRWCYRGMHSRT